MTTTTAIITQAFREPNLIAVGATPTAAQQAEAMTLLASLVAGVYGFDVGERLTDWLVGSRNITDPSQSEWTANSWVYPIPNSRILLNHTTAQTLYFPLSVDDGARMQVIDTHGVLATYNVTLDGNGREIEAAATKVLSTNGTNSTWMFNADTSNWVLISTLALDDEMPFDIQFDGYFTTKLAARLEPRYGRSLSEYTLAYLNEVREQLETKYRQRRTMPAPAAVQRGSTPNRRTSSIPRTGKYGWMV